MPKISVIVPIYKVEPYIHRCIDSILAQTYTDFELILIDDGSPDNCGIICDKYAAKDNRIHVIHQANGGLSAARNAGIDWAFANSDSEWLYFADSDDWIHPKSLEALINGAEQTDSSVVIGGFGRTEGENPEVNENSLTATVWDTESYFCEHNVNATVAWGKIYRKECFETIRYPVGKIHEDEFTTYKILFKFDKLAVINQPLYAYYQNPNGIMGTVWNPNRLDGAKAFNERVSFFNSCGNKRMAQITIEALFDNLTWQEKMAKISTKKLNLIRVKCLVIKMAIKYFGVLNRSRYYYIAKCFCPRLLNFLIEIKHDWKK